MSVTLNGVVYQNSDFSGLGYVAIFPEEIFTNMLAELATNGLAAFETTPITLTVSTLSTQAHGLGARPNRVKAVLQCVSTELGFAVGEEVGLEYVATTAGVKVCSVVADATNIYVAMGSGAPAIARKSATIGAITAIDISKWRIIVRANP